jgi:hypothetical protein
MVISLTTNKDANKDVDVNFSITGGADQDKFTLSGNTLTFAATDLMLKSALVVVKVRASAAVSASVALRVPTTVPAG